MKSFLYNKENTLLVENKLEEKGILPMLLMMRAGYNIYKIIKEKIKYDEIIVLIGSGNNGGDAIAFAIQAALNNEKVICLRLTNKKKMPENLLSIAKNIGLKISKFKKSIFETRKKKVIVDGILGIGISRETKGLIYNSIEYINNLSTRNKIVVSIDIPSGLNPNNGIVINNAIYADFTIMCLTRKPGCYTGDGLKYSGKLYYTDLGIKNIDKIHRSDVVLLHKKQQVFLKRDHFGHKGNFGSVLILGGWNNMPGAANLAALAALKVGCGKVFVCSNNFENLPDEVIRVEPNVQSILKILENINVIIAGPGLGQEADKILDFIWKTKVPLVLDAGGFDWLSNNFKQKRKAMLIATPHYGEARKLLGYHFRDRVNAVKHIKHKYGGKWILKGPGTIIFSNKLYINEFSNSILATAGTGDVLAGIVAGLVAQDFKNSEILGVEIHTAAATRLLKSKNKTLLASELINNISTSIS